MIFNSKILIVPGLGNSDKNHWQSKWEQKHPEFKRVIQKEWDKPKCDDWVNKLEEEIINEKTNNIILVGHSSACAAISCWARKYKRIIKGALLVAPSDPEADTYPKGPTGFKPITLEKFPFRSIVVASSDDPYVSLERAKLFAYSWGSELNIIENAGHINVASGFGEWEEGLKILKALDS
jgi:uncharacterized protein